MSIQTLTEDDHSALDNWLETFTQQLYLLELSYLNSAVNSVTASSINAAENAARNMGLISAFATSYITYARINNETEGMSSEFISLKSNLSSGTAIVMSSVGTGLAAVSFAGGPTAPFLLATGLTLIALTPNAQAIVEQLIDDLAQQAIAQFGSDAADLLLQSEHIWGTDENDNLTAMNPSIIQHIHGVGGENTLIGSNGRNFIYGGPNKDEIITGEGDNVVFADPVPTFSQLYRAVGGDNEIITGDGNNKIYAYNGNNTITLGNGDNEVFSGRGSDTIIAGYGNNIIDAGGAYAGAEALFSTGQIMNALHPDDWNTVDYSALNRSLVVRATLNEPLSSRRDFTVDKIDAAGSADTTTDLLISIHSIIFSADPGTVMLEGSVGRTTDARFLADPGPDGTIHTVDFSNATGNGLTGAGVTVLNTAGGEGFLIGDLYFEGFTRLIGSAYRDTISMSVMTENLIIDSGEGGADIWSGSGNDIIRFDGEGMIDAGDGFDILDRSHLEGDTHFSLGSGIVTLNQNTDVWNVQHFKGSQGNNTFVFDENGWTDGNYIIFEGNTGNDTFHINSYETILIYGGGGNNTFIGDPEEDYAIWFAEITDINRLSDVDIAALTSLNEGVIIVNRSPNDQFINISFDQEPYYHPDLPGWWYPEDLPPINLDNYLITREFLDDADLPETDLPDQEAALARRDAIVFPELSLENDPFAHLNPFAGGHPHHEPDSDPDPDPVMMSINFPDTYASLSGTDGNDVLTGSEANEHFDGGYGNDMIEAVAGNNIIDGGRGNDHMISGTGSDTFIFRLAYGHNLVEGFDVTQDRIALDALSPTDLAFHDLGTSSILAANDGTIFWFDAMTGYTLADLVFVDLDGQPIAISSAYVRIQGTFGDDELFGADEQDNHILGGAGNDIIHAVGGNNILDGGTGNDILHSGTGNDTFVFRAGDGMNNVIGFDPTRDRIALDGVELADLSFYQYWNGAQIYLADGTDFFFEDLTGVTMDAFIFVDMDGNLLAAQEPLIVLQGTTGDDTLIGSSSQNNHIIGDAGDDFLYGVGGDNILDGGTGNDFMASGAGQDTFVFRLGDGQNVIQDFDITQDRIALDGLTPNDVDVIGSTGGTQLLAADGTEFWFIGLTGVSKTDLSFVDMDGNPLAAQEPLIVLQGTAGDDSLVGSSTQNNHIIGDAGDDYLFGVGGDNLLDGGTGNDFMTSGAGQDTFVFRLGDGQNVIENFDITQDRIALDDLDEEDLTLTDFGGGSALVAADGTEFWFIGLTGATRSDLSFVNYDQII
ncbi:MAG: hypothetical protein ACXIVD_00425 [Salinarimonas sp.]